MVHSLERLTTGTAPGHGEPEYGAGLELVYGVNKRIRSSPQMNQMLEQVIRTTQKTLNIEAASILLFGDNEEELFFEVASGPVGKVLRKVKLSTRYGIAGQVVRTGKPLIVNDVARSEKFHKMIDDTTGFQTRSLVCAPLMDRQRVLGVIEVLNKLDGSDFDEQDLEAVVAVATTTAMAIENTRQHQVILDAFRNTVSTLAAAIDAKDPYACGHSQRVKEYAVMAAGYFALSPGEMDDLRNAAVLHDIGKIKIDSCILSKSSPLTEEEWYIIRQHPVTGASLLEQITYLEKAGNLVRYHHERYDGKGYPEGLRGEAIPLGARLIAVAEAFDTMTTGRAYQPMMTIEQALREIEDNAGTQFCPSAVTAFVSGLRLHTGGQPHDSGEPGRPKPEF